MDEMKNEDELPREEGEDILDYFARYADWLKLKDYGPNGNLERDALAAIALGNRIEFKRIQRILERRNSANMTVIK